MTKNYWYLLFFLVAFLGEINAQNPVSNFSYHNPFYFNPAMAGVDKKRRLTFNYSLKNEERNGLISYEHPSKNLNHNLGIFLKVLTNTTSRSVSINKIGLAYNYTFKFSKITSLTSGFQFTQFYIGGGGASLSSSSWESISNMDLGLVLAIKKFKLGASVFNLWQLTEEDEVVGPITVIYQPIRQTRDINTTISYDMKINKDIEAGLSFLYNEKLKDYRTFDFSGHALFYKTFMLGGTWRVQERSFVKLFIGIQRWEYYWFQFSFNIKKDEIGPRNVELILQYDL